VDKAGLGLRISIPRKNRRLVFWATFRLEDKIRTFSRIPAEFKPLALGSTVPADGNFIFFKTNHLLASLNLLEKSPVF
jgi:hypothetical protein